MFPKTQEILTSRQLTRMPRTDNILRVKPYQAIAAMSLNRVIGAANKIPWHLPEDFKWFKQKTTGNVIVMGRRTFESIGRALPNRITIVLSRAGINIPGVVTMGGLDELNSRVDEFTGKEIFICGGAQIYAQAIDSCSDLFLTLVKREVQGDAFFPMFETNFELVEEIIETPEFKVLHYRARG
jgi:dihydrofolate reductase